MMPRRVIQVGYICRIILDNTVIGPSDWNEIISVFIK